MRKRSLFILIFSIAIFAGSAVRLYAGPSTNSGMGGGSSMTYPDAGVPNSTGTAWGTSYAVDTDLSSVSGNDDTLASAKAIYTALLLKQAASSLLTALAELTPTSGYIVKGTGTGYEMSDEIDIGSPDYSDADWSIPWVVDSTTPGTFNVNGMAYYDSGVYKLYIRDQTNTRNLAFVPEGIATGGLIFGTSTPATAGGIGYSIGYLRYYNTALRTVANTDEAQSFSSKTLVLPIISGTPTTAGHLGYVSSALQYYNGAVRTVVNTDEAQSISGKIMNFSITEVDGHVSGSLSAANVSHTVIYNAGMGATAAELTLPATAAGYKFTPHVSESSAAEWKFTAATAGTMCLDGVCGKSYVKLSTPDQGNYVECRTVRIPVDGIYTSAALAIGTTTTAVASGAFNYHSDGSGYSAAANAAGTALSGSTVPQNLYGAWALDIGEDGTIDVTPATDNATGYSTAVLAAAGLPACGADHVRVGYVTAMNTDAAGFVPGTTALDAATVTEAYTNSAVLTPVYHWVCKSMTSTAWATD